MKTKSFTLIELLVVIVIIGILAAVIIVSTSSSIGKANIAKVKVFENSVQNELGANMVSRWKLDEIVETTTTPDAWGSNTGTLGDGVTASTYPTLKEESECVTGKCMYFDGVDDYIDLGTNVMTFPNNSFTFSVWTNQKGYTNKGSIYNCIAGSGSMSDTGWGLALGSTNQFLIIGIANEFKTFSNSFLIDNWHHVVFVQDVVRDRAFFYLDGIPSSILTTTLELSGNYNFYLGRDIGLSRSGEQIMDDARIYNSALSTSQIKQEYIAGLNSLLASNSISEKEYNERINSLALNND